MNGKLQSLIGGTLSIVTLAIACAPKPAPGPLDSDIVGIVGGKPVGPSDPEAASAVLIVVNNGLCSGTLIAPDLVLTAAHCVVDPEHPKTSMPSEKVTLIFGNASLDLAGEEPKLTGAAAARAFRIVAHEDYLEDGRTSDIALIQFELDLPEGLRPAPLLSLLSSEALADNAVVTSAGFGRTSAQGQLKEVRLRKTDLRIDVGSQPFHEALLLSRAGEEPQGICSGDSGGPTYVKVDGSPYLWGVNSMADHDCLYKSLILNVTQFRPWLDLQAKSLGTSIPGFSEELLHQEETFRDCMEKMDPYINPEWVQAASLCRNIALTFDASRVERFDSCWNRLAPVFWSEKREANRLCEQKALKTPQKAWGRFDRCWRSLSPVWPNEKLAALAKCLPER